LPFPFLSHQNTINEGGLVKGVQVRISKPDLKMPDDFWKNTGYEPSLKDK
jgi:hypothetical protein